VSWRTTSLYKNQSTTTVVDTDFDFDIYDALTFATDLSTTGRKGVKKLLSSVRA